TLDGLCAFGVLFPNEKRSCQNGHGRCFIVWSICTSKFCRRGLRGRLRRCGVAFVKRDLRQSKLVLRHSGLLAKLLPQRQRVFVLSPGGAGITVDQVDVTQPAQLMRERSLL